MQHNRLLCTKRLRRHRLMQLLWMSSQLILYLLRNILQIRLCVLVALQQDEGLMRLIWMQSQRPSWVLYMLQPSLRYEPYVPMWWQNLLCRQLRRFRMRM